MLQFSFKSSIVFEDALKLSRFILIDAHTILSAILPAAIVTDFQALQLADPIFLALIPLSFICCLILFVLHLPEAMFLIIFELSEVSIAVFIVVNAIEGVSLVELPHKELAIGEEVGALTME